MNTDHTFTLTCAVCGRQPTTVPSGLTIGKSTRTCTIALCKQHADLRAIAIREPRVIELLKERIDIARNFKRNKQRRLNQLSNMASLPPCRSRVTHTGGISLRWELWQRAMCRHANATNVVASLVKILRLKEGGDQ